MADEAADNLEAGRDAEHSVAVDKGTMGSHCAATPVETTVEAPIGAKPPPGDKASSSSTADKPARRPYRFLRVWRDALWGILTSSLVHVLVLVLLGLIVLKPQFHREVTSLFATQEAVDANAQSMESLATQSFEDPSSHDLNSEPLIAATALSQDNRVESITIDEHAAISPKLDKGTIGLEQPAAAGDLLSDIVGAIGAASLSGRGAASRGALIKTGGGSEASEAAVAEALRWLAQHQHSDGSWNFDHRLGPCRGRCGNPGLLRQCTTGATGLALLPFLGAGQTHKNGEYQRTIESGLGYLVSHMQVDTKNNLGSLVEGAGLYDHAIATIALCEAYAMSQDRDLEKPAQLAINFIAAAQNPVGGGWRYKPGDPGDTSVVGWQMMALTSARMAYLRVPQNVFQGAEVFLNFTQSNGGAFYGYKTSSTLVSPGTTAAGLLSRMYLGWNKESKGLERGVDWMGRHGPSDANMYYNYYATQVMHHWGGDPWKKWNPRMRDYLVRTQSKLDHEKGSWFFPSAGGEFDYGEYSAGRLYFTALSAMTLEVYYRYLPLYREDSTNQQPVAENQ